MTTIKRCEKLWADCVKAKADYKSELSGKTEKLHAHHIIGKPNYRLRFELKNGICLTAGEHFYGIHNQGRQKEYEERIKKVKGDDIYAKLILLKHYKGKTNLTLVEIYLKNKLKEIKNNKG